VGGGVFMKFVLPHKLGKIGEKEKKRKIEAIFVVLKKRPINILTLSIRFITQKNTNVSVRYT